MKKHLEKQLTDVVEVIHCICFTHAKIRIESEKEKINSHVTNDLKSDNCLCRYFKQKQSKPDILGDNRKRFKQSTKVDQKSLETVFLIAICRPTGDKWQSKTMFLTVFDLSTSIVLVFLIAACPVWYGPLSQY